MNEIWQGAFLQKSVGTATFIPLFQMTPADWRLLDWELLRNKAKNDIVAAAQRGPIDGFIHFKFLSKGSAAGGYLAPVVVGDNVDDLMANPPVRNTLDEDLDVTTVALDMALDKIAFLADSARSTLGLGVKLGVFIILTKMLKEIPSTDEDALRAIVNGEAGDYEELDVLLAFAFTVLAKHDIEWLKEWADEAEQVLGDAEDKGLI